MKQLKSLDAIAGLTIDLAMLGNLSVNDNGDSLVIPFTNDTFIVIVAVLNWSDGADIKVSCESLRPSPLLVDAGVCTSEELRIYRTRKEHAQAEHTKSMELRQLEKLKKRYE